jgi:hypothetical protein
MGRKWIAVLTLGMAYIVAAAVAVDDKGLSLSSTVAAPEKASSLGKVASLGGITYHHVWPVMIKNRNPFCCLRFYLYLPSLFDYVSLSTDMSKLQDYVVG